MMYKLLVLVLVAVVCSMSYATKVCTVIESNTGAGAGHDYNCN